MARLRSSVAITVLLSLASMTGVAHAASIVVTGAGAPVSSGIDNNGRPFDFYSYNFGDVALGDSRSVSIEVVFGVESPEINSGNSFSYIEFPTSGQFSFSITGGSVGSSNNGGCDYAGCTHTIDFGPTALGATSLLLSILQGAYYQIDPECGAGPIAVNCEIVDTTRYAYITFDGNGVDPAVVPLPAALPLFASGLGGLFLAGRRKRRVSG